MRMVYITKKKPKQKLRLDGLEPEDLNVDLDVVSKWSDNNKELYELVL